MTSRSFGRQSTILEEGVLYGGNTGGRDIRGRGLSWGVVYKGETVMQGGIHGVGTIQTRLYHAFMLMYMYTKKQGYLGAHKGREYRVGGVCTKGETSIK